MNIHGYEVDVKDEESESIKSLVRSWEAHPSDFKGALHQLQSDPKIYIGKIVFERKDGKYILRKSSQ